MEVEPGPLGQPSADLRINVGRVVVQNQMQVETGRRLPVAGTQERK